MELLKPYFEIAAQEAKKSPCVRRQYGSVIVYPGLEFKHVSAHNFRVGACCDYGCVRERLNVSHNGSVEVGSEIHSESAVLLKRWREIPNDHIGKGFFILVGFDSKTKKELLGDRVVPCHTCSLMIKSEGFDWIHIRNSSKEIVPVSVSEIIESRERVWAVE